jgi:putative FmdB family regulatory protein
MAMPIYEYACSDCGKEFETLVRSGSTPECPECHSHSLEKKLSVFASAGTGGGHSHSHAGPCGSCGHPNGPGSCAIN